MYRRHRRADIGSVRKRARSPGRARISGVRAAGSAPYRPCSSMKDITHANGEFQLMVISFTDQASM